MLDTLKYSKRLQAAGVTPEQADAQAEALHEAVSETTATREHLEHVEQRLNAKLESTEQRLNAKLWDTEQRLNTKIDRLRADMEHSFHHQKTLIQIVLGLALVILGRLFFI